MISAFYSAGSGVVAQQQKMNVIANNMANINTAGYKTKTTVFADLMYKNYPDAQAGQLQTGVGAKVDKINTKFSEPGSYNSTGEALDFAIQGSGYFAVSDLEGENTLYTRDGRFMISIIDDTQYLTNSSGLLVLNADGEPIEMEDLGLNAATEDLNIGVFKIPVEDGMLSDGYNNYSLTENSGEAEVIDNPNLIRGTLETSNVDMAQEMSQVIESQRAYSMMLKMVQTSDEMEQEVNGLRR